MHFYHVNAVGTFLGEQILITRLSACVLVGQQII